MKPGFLAVRRSVVLAGLLAIGLASPALADRAFTARFSTNANGDIAIVGNTLETCQTSVADCANARAGLGTVLNNNNFSMVRVNTDSTALDSSSARLSLPAGARVLFAGLYYGSRTTAGTGGKAAPDSSLAGLSKVDFKPPDASGFDHLTASVDQSTDVTGAYAAFVDVTGRVQRAGSGVYTVANVQSATGEDRYAGWALVVAYEAAGEPPRSRSPTRVSRRRPTSSPPTRSRPTPRTSRGRCESRARPRARPLQPTSSATTRASTTPRRAPCASFSGAVRRPGVEERWRSPARPATPRRSASRSASTTT